MEHSWQLFPQGDEIDHVSVSAKRTVLELLFKETELDDDAYVNKVPMPKLNECENVLIY